MTDYSRLDEQTARVLNGFLNLSPEQKAKFIEALRTWADDSDGLLREFRENSGYKGLDLGPWNQNRCPCCGK